ncbi:MAG: hypothetical protein KDD48_08615, partial [Bdellovibrionales bacterium]|nr:hypothetical protein [Bdellovibrionales bacterium]
MREGTCDRDFVHVTDLADTHYRLLEQMTEENCGISRQSQKNPWLEPS